MNSPILATAIAICALSTGIASAASPKVKALSPAMDVTQKTVLIGRNVATDMVVTLEIEGAEKMWMQMGTPPHWMEQPVAKDEIFHIEVKLVDPVSKTRISYSSVNFSAVNVDNKKTVTGMLHPSWGASGLHYGYNSPLAGDGTYEATVTAGVPTFGRTDENKGKWLKPVTTKFHFKLAGVKLIEVTEPAAESK